MSRQAFYEPKYIKDTSSFKNIAATVQATGTFVNLISYGKPAERINLADISQFSHTRKPFIYDALSTIDNIQDKKLYLESQKQLLSSYDFLLDYSDDEIKSLSSSYARRFGRLFLDIVNFKSSYIELHNEFVSHGFDLASYSDNKPQNYYRSLYKRFTNELFFRRIFRTYQIRTVEKLSLESGRVSRSTSQLYVSDKALSMRQFHKQRNKQLLESMVSTNDQNQQFDLLTLSNKSTSNPKLKRNELMTRLRGLEEFADLNKLVADFYTLTAPSVYHRYSSKKTSSGHTYFLNKRFNYSSPRQTQQYLNKQWSKIRSSLNKQSIEIMGMRVAEPHHDGTPHWHLLLFFQKQHRTAIRQTFRKYALEFYPDEKGAQKHRFTAIKITKKNKHGKKQSAVGYIAKYISKNLSFDDIQTNDFKNYGESVKHTVNRVEAWSSIHGIRQFQQIGGERITVWRELRRVRDDSLVSDYFLPLHKAADSADYKQFLIESRKLKHIQIQRKWSHLRNKLFGFHFVKTEVLDKSTGELTSNFYRNREVFNKFDELIQPPIIGISSGDNYLITRQFDWFTSIRKLSLFNSMEAGHPDGASRREDLLPLDLCH
jgi:hypothetical protein